MSGTEQWHKVELIKRNTPWLPYFVSICWGKLIDEGTQLQWLSTLCNLMNSGCNAEEIVETNHPSRPKHFPLTVLLCLITLSVQSRQICLKNVCFAVLVHQNYNGWIDRMKFSQNSPDGFGNIVTHCCTVIEISFYEEKRSCRCWKKSPCHNKNGVGSV